jgi:hypothetical protein
VDRLDEIEIVVSYTGKDQNSILEILHIARRLGDLFTFLISKHTTVQPYRYVIIDQRGVETRDLQPELFAKILPSPNLLDINLSTSKIDQLVYSPDGKMEPIRRLLNYYSEGCQPQLIDQILSFYKIVEDTGQTTEKEKTLRHMFSHSKLTKHKTVVAARKHFGSEDIRQADIGKIEAARDDLESHVREILSKRLGICHQPTKFYAVK